MKQPRPNSILLRKKPLDKAQLLAQHQQQQQNQLQQLRQNYHNNNQTPFADQGGGGDGNGNVNGGGGGGTTGRRKQGKRTSFSESVRHHQHHNYQHQYQQQRRISGISMAISEGNTSHSRSSIDGTGGGGGGTYDADNILRTSSTRTAAAAATTTTAAAAVKNSMKRMSDSAISRESSASNSSSTKMDTLLFHCHCCSCCYKSYYFEKSNHIMKKIVTHTIWNGIILCLTFILVFGGSIQNAFLPKSVDPYVDIIFTITFVMLLLDIWMLCCTAPNYFVFRPTLRRITGEQEGCCFIAFQIGSLMFWFDIISVLSLLFEISYIYTPLNDIPTTILHVGGYGLSGSGSGSSSLSLSSSSSSAASSFYLFNYFHIELIVSIIVRLTRLNRILKVSIILYIQSMISNIHTYINDQLLQRHCKLDKNKNNNNNNNDNNDSQHGGSNKLTNTTTDTNGGTRTRTTRTSTTTTTTTCNWCGSRRSRKHLEEKERHEEAACKIQRAWRAQKDPLNYTQNYTHNVVVNALLTAGETYRAKEARLKLAKANGGNGSGGGSGSGSGSGGGFTTHETCHLNNMNTDRSMSMKAVRNRIKNILSFSTNRKSKYTMRNSRMYGSSSILDTGESGTSLNSLSSIGRKERSNKRKQKSHIGSAMTDSTMRRVAMGIVTSILLTTIFTYQEDNYSPDLTIISMHNTMTSLQQYSSSNSSTSTTTTTKLEENGKDLIDLVHMARNSSVPSLCSYNFTSQDGKVEVDLCERDVLQKIRNRDMRLIQVCSSSDSTIDNEHNYAHGHGHGHGHDHICDGILSSSLFALEDHSKSTAMVLLLFIFFILFVWIFGSLLLIGPVTTLVIVPIERMIRLLSMLVDDPLGYTKRRGYKAFIDEQNELAKNTLWTDQNLNGMETSFLTSTILRIGSLMKVGFGSAGVEIIKNNLRKGRNTGISLVACIFMFCDIRGFTDSSECLKEEVFVFTNRIAAVVHSYCHAFGGSANKNIGDAFLLSWKLDSPPICHESGFATGEFTAGKSQADKFTAGKSQADKALLSAVKICIALYHESYFLEGLTEKSITALKNKFADRPGNLVQLGFGLHAGKAVEGAIGSQRKLDATYLSEAVELSEYLESSTKAYGVNVLMSGKFYNLLHRSVKEKCRKIDHVFFTTEGDNVDEEIGDEYHMSLHTYDMNIDALFEENRIRSISKSILTTTDESVRSKHSSSGQCAEDKRGPHVGRRTGSFIRRSIQILKNAEMTNVKGGEEEPLSNSPKTHEKGPTRKLDIPEGTLRYKLSIWTYEDFWKIRERFTSKFFENFRAGYLAYISSDWKKAQPLFEFMVKEFQDKPSQYFLDKMKECKFNAPINFNWRKKKMSMEYH